MTYEEKLAKAKEMVEAHAKAAGVDSPWDEFRKKLFASGGTSDEGLRVCSWEDLEEYGLPKLLAKQVAVVFRGKDEPSRPVVSVQRAAAMPVHELVDRYDPREADNPVGARLKVMTSGKRCVVFNGDGSVNAAVTAELVNAIRDGFPEREVYMLNGNPSIVYRIGDRPDLMFDEDPLSPGQILQPNGDSTVIAGLNWSGVSQEAKVLVYLAVRDSREIRIVNTDDAFRVHELASGEEAAKKLRARYAKAAIRYDELARTCQLPPLKTVRAVARKQDPFSVGGQNRTI